MHQDIRYSCCFLYFSCWLCRRMLSFSRRTICSLIFSRLSKNVLWLALIISLSLRRVSILVLQSAIWFFALWISLLNFSICAFLSSTSDDKDAFRCLISASSNSRAAISELILVMFSWINAVFCSTELNLILRFSISSLALSSSAFFASSCLLRFSISFLELSFCISSALKLPLTWFLFSSISLICLSILCYILPSSFHLFN